MKLYVAACLWAVFFAFPYCAVADDASTMLAKHRAFVGWEFGNGSLPPMQFDRTMTDTTTGAIVQRAHEVREGMLYRRDYSGEGFDGTSTGFTGNVVWEANRNGFPTPFVGISARLYISLDAIFTDSLSTYPSALRANATLDGASYPVLRIVVPQGFTIDAYVDPATGAYKGFIMDPDGKNRQVVHVRSYMNIGAGKRYIGSWSFDVNPYVYTYTSAKALPGVDPSTFTPSPSQAKWRFTNPHPFGITVGNGRMLIDATVNGVAGRFILDTGDSTITLTDSFADRAHVKKLFSESAFGFGGGSTSFVRKVDTLEVGGNSLSNVFVNTVGQRLGDGDLENVDGLFGFDFFAGAIVTVDTMSRTAQIQDPVTAVVRPEGGMHIPIDLTLGTPLASITLDGNTPIDAMLDTGNPAYVIFPPHQHTFETNMRLQTSGIGGVEDMYCGHVGSIGLGSVVSYNPIACESNSAGTTVIGFDFLQRFNYVFDYPHSQIVMTPHR